MLLCVIKILCPSLDALLCFINTNTPHSFFHLYKITKLVYNIRKKKSNTLITTVGGFAVLFCPPTKKITMVGEYTSQKNKIK